MIRDGVRRWVTEGCWDGHLTVTGGGRGGGQTDRESRTNVGANTCGMPNAVIACGVFSLYLHGKSCSVRFIQYAKPIGGTCSTNVCVRTRIIRKEK